MFEFTFEKGKDEPNRFGSSNRWRRQKKIKYFHNQSLHWTRQKRRSCELTVMLLKMIILLI